MAAANVLPKTGQTTSYRDGDDGYYEAGWEGDRFTDNGDGTITDNATGLMWPDDANGAGGNNGNVGTWNMAIDYAEALDFAGHDDWRLPNIHELMSLIDHGVAFPAITTMIQNAQTIAPWISTTLPPLTDWAWIWRAGQLLLGFLDKTTGQRFICCRTA